MGSSPIPATNGPLVKRLRHRPFTAVTGVRFSHGSPKKNTCTLCGCSFLSSRVHSTRQSAKALCGSSHFASKAEPSSLGLATSKNIRRRRNSPSLFPFTIKITAESDKTVTLCGVLFTFLHSSNNLLHRFHFREVLILLFQ